MSASRTLTSKLLAPNSLLRLSRNANATTSAIHRRTILSRNLNRALTTTPRLRNFSTTSQSRKGLSPETDDPQIAPKPPQHGSTYGSGPAEISAEKFHELADEYLNLLVEKLEELQEQKEEVDVEYSAGVLTLLLPPVGTYVINKQPPNKQIWLSSPITGPKRYDYVMRSEGQDSKEGTGSGEWVYLRDGSTLTSLLGKECGVDMGVVM